MKKEHKCPLLEKYNIDNSLHITTIRYYELGGWEIERQEPWESDSTSIDEIHFCPYCGIDLEKEIHESN